MYFFWLIIETEMLKYENQLYKLSIKKKYHYHHQKPSQKGKNIQKRNLPYLLFRENHMPYFVCPFNLFKSLPDIILLEFQERLLICEHLCKLDSLSEVQQCGESMWLYLINKYSNEGRQVCEKLSVSECGSDPNPQARNRGAIFTSKTLRLQSLNDYI